MIFFFFFRARTPKIKEPDAFLLGRPDDFLDPSPPPRAQFFSFQYEGEAFGGGPRLLLFSPQNSHYPPSRPTGHQLSKARSPALSFALQKTHSIFPFFFLWRRSALLIASYSRALHDCVFGSFFLLFAILKLDSARTVKSFQIFFPSAWRLSRPLPCRSPALLPIQY